MILYTAQFLPESLFMDIGWSFPAKNVILKLKFYIKKRGD